jgi:hypothetical protein
MMKRISILVFALALAVGVAGGCSSSDSSNANSKFVGLWHMSLAGDPADPGFDWRFNADQTTIVLYNTGSTSAKGSGSCTIAGDSASGTWSAGDPNTGRFTATLTGDNSMDFNFIEEKYSPAKTFVYVGARLE